MICAIISFMLLLQALVEIPDGIANASFLVSNINENTCYINIAGCRYWSQSPIHLDPPESQLLN